jgi:uncharacterized protein YqeY
MNLYERFQHDMKVAMKARDTLRVDVMRMAMSAIKAAHGNQVKQAYDAAGGESNPAASAAAAANVVLSDAQMLDIIGKQVKQRQEAAAIYYKGNRPELAAKEEHEAAILSSYLPRMLTADELRPHIIAIIQQVGAKSAADMNKVMPVVMQHFKGQADGRVLNQLVRELLGA